MSVADGLAREVDKIRGKRVLVAPLDWGLGHATRCVPIVNALLEAGKQVVIAGSGASFAFLRSEFSSLEAVEFHGMSVHYSRSQTQVFAVLCQLPYMLTQIWLEHRRIKRLVCRYGIDTVISDNRFGLWCRGVETVYITHQLRVKMPNALKWIEPMVCYLHRRIIAQYDVCWIPDVEGEGNLSGELAHGMPMPQNAVYVGWLSRFACCSEYANTMYKNVALVSGPEPQRTLFEQEMLTLLQNRNEPSILLCGRMDERVDRCVANVRVVSHLSTHDLCGILQGAERIYCRSGYTTLMDLATLRRKAFLYPTPGQTEQEYLALYHNGGPCGVRLE